VVEPDGFSIKIDKIREGMRFFSLKSYRLKNKVMFIKDAWAFSPAAANAFLKTLEEPPRNSFIAIATSKLEGLLPTIISRCRKIFLPALPENLDRGTEESVSAFLRGEDLRFPDRKKFSAFLWELITVLRRGLLSRSGYNNKRLPGNRESEIIVNSYSLEQIAGILKDILEIYGAAKSINMNLALNLIRLKL
jgi:hypothetical protein